MTIDEAIKVIENEIRCVNTDCDIERNCGKCPYSMPSVEPIALALCMAVLALKQYGVLQEIRQEIEDHMESSIGIYDSNTPLSDRPYVKLERNNARDECIAIIDKHMEEYKP